MDWLGSLLDIVLHLDRHLVQLLQLYGVWIYPLLFCIIFAETGFVVTPFLPGDSLLFGAGALAAVDASGTLEIGWLLLLLSIAAVAGNTLNFHVGHAIGERAFAGRLRYVRREHLERTRRFFAHHGGMAIVLSRFTPIVRTFAPFVAGVGRMNWWRFQAFNVAGGVGWVTLLSLAGFAFGNVPLVKNNFGVATLVIVALSLIPLAWAVWNERRADG